MQRLLISEEESSSGDPWTQRSLTEGYVHTYSTISGFCNSCPCSIAATFYISLTYMATTARYFDSILLYAKERPWAALYIFTKEESGRSFKCLRNHRNYLLIANSCCKPLDRRLTFVKCIRSHDSSAVNVDGNRCQARVCRWLCPKRCRAEPPKTNCHHCKPRNAGRVQTQNCVAVATTVEILISSLTIHIKLKHFGSSFKFCW